MKIQQLFDLLNINDTYDHINLNEKVTGVTDDSRKVERGFIFVAVRGYTVDGHNFVEEAVSNGAAVIVSEEPLDQQGILCLQTTDSRKALGKIASAFYGHPSNGKIVIGVTGTNGKTTISHMIKHICEANGYSCSMFGTVDYVVNGNAVPGVETTPGAPVLQKLLHESDDDVVVMEVSSHGLQQNRLEGMTFDYCVFSNLHKDHLDYHKSMEDYFQAKSALFFMMKDGGQALINTDDPWGAELSKRLAHESIAHLNVGSDSTCDFKIKNIDSKRFSAIVEENGSETVLQAPIKGIHNVYNSIEAFAIGRLLGIIPEKIDQALSSFPGVRGRFETFEMPNRATVVIDYAHTADSIDHVLKTVKQQGAKHVTHVFGFRGDRDLSKRTDMLTASVQGSDSYILTLDDLNTSSFEEMVDMLTRYQEAHGDDKGRVIPDRTLAIEDAVMNSREGDWIMITGKGHESYQQTYHYPAQSDKEMIECIHTKLKEKEKI